VSFEYVEFFFYYKNLLLKKNYRFYFLNFFGYMDNDITSSLLLRRTSIYMDNEFWNLNFKIGANNKKQAHVLCILFVNIKIYKA
jgi:hypothetical protein